MSEASDEGKTPFLRSPGGIALLVFGAIAGFFLVLEHRAHLYGILPFLILALCPLMHLFMHRGHGGHGDGKSGDQHAGHRHENER